MNYTIRNYSQHMLLLFILILGVMTFLRLPDNLKKASDKLEQAEEKIDISMNMLRAQNEDIASLIKQKELILKVMDSLRDEHEYKAGRISRRLTYTIEKLDSMRKTGAKIESLIMSEIK